MVIGLLQQVSRCWVFFPALGAPSRTNLLASLTEFPNPSIYFHTATENRARCSGSKQNRPKGFFLHLRPQGVVTLGSRSDHSVRLQFGFEPTFILFGIRLRPCSAQEKKGHLKPEENLWKLFHSIAPLSSNLESLWIVDFIVVAPLFLVVWGCLSRRSRKSEKHTSNSRRQLVCEMLRKYMGLAT